MQDRFALLVVEFGPLLRVNSAAFGYAATRLETFVVKGGTYSYGFRWTRG